MRNWCFLLFLRADALFLVLAAVLRGCFQCLEVGQVPGKLHPGGLGHVGCSHGGEAWHQRILLVLAASIAGDDDGALVTQAHAPDPPVQHCENQAWSTHGIPQSTSHGNARRSCLVLLRSPAAANCRIFAGLGAIVVEASMAQLPIAGVTPNVQAMVPSNHGGVPAASKDPGATLRLVGGGTIVMRDCSLHRHKAHTLDSTAGDMPGAHSFWNAALSSKVFTEGIEATILVQQQ